MPAFAPAQRFVTEVEQRKLRPAYVFVGDEAFFRRRCREAILQHLVPPDVRDFSLHELDLAETPLAEVLDRPVVAADLADLRRVQRAAVAALGVTTALEAFRFDEAAHLLYHFLWGSFCDWYLESIKPRLAEEERLWIWT